jgi:hypothetical protein
MAVLAAILLPSILHAQITFQRTYGGTDNDGAYSVQQTDDGGYIIAGDTRSFGAGEYDVYLIKTNALGDTQWTRTPGGADAEGAYSVEQTADGGYILAGETFGAAGPDIYLVRTDAGGDTLWTRTFGNPGDEDMANQVRQTADDGFIVVGHSWLYGPGNSDVRLIKTDANGDTLWTRTIGGTGDEEGNSVQQTADGGYIVAGATESFGTGRFDVYLIKLNGAGDTLWTKTFGDTTSDEGHSVEQTADGGYIITGATNYNGGAGQRDLYLVKTDVNGDALWTRTIGGSDDDEGSSVRQTADGGYIIAGSTLSFGAGTYDVYLVKTDANGDTLWTKTYGGSQRDLGWSVCQTTDGGYVIAAYTQSFGAGGEDVYLVKTDSLGNVAVAEPKASPTRAPALLLSCEPNPCRGATTIRTSYIVPRSSLSIFDAQGSRVRTFTVNRAPYIVWDGRDELGHALPSGAYFVRVDNGNEHSTTRLILQR